MSCRDMPGVVQMPASHHDFPGTPRIKEQMLWCANGITGMFPGSQKLNVISLLSGN